MRRRKIFVLEDDEGIREVLEMILISEDYLVETFSSISEFLKRDITSPPDLYLFDVRLPDGSGIEVLRKIRETEENGTIPAIIMSAHADINDFKGICVPDDFISKPFDVDYLLGRIRGIIDYQPN